MHQNIFKRMGSLQVLVDGAFHAVHCPHRVPRRATAFEGCRFLLGGGKLALLSVQGSCIVLIKCCTLIWYDINLTSRQSRKAPIIHYTVPFRCQAIATDGTTVANCRNVCRVAAKLFLGMEIRGLKKPSAHSRVRTSNYDIEIGIRPAARHAGIALFAA